MRSTSSATRARASSPSIFVTSSRLMTSFSGRPPALYASTMGLAFAFACEYGAFVHFGVIEELLSLRANVDSMNDMRKTALALAAEDAARAALRRVVPCAQVVVSHSYRRGVLECQKSPCARRWRSLAVRARVRDSSHVVPCVGPRLVGFALGVPHVASASMYTEKQMKYFYKM